MNPNEVDKFFDELPTADKREADIFAAPKIEEKPEPVEGEEPHKNRRHRRLEEQLERERVSNIQLNERLKMLEEAKAVVEKEPGEIDDRLIDIFGSDDNGKAIAKRFSSYLEERDKKVRHESLAEIDAREDMEIQEQKGYESYIDSQLENLEDQYGIDLTSSDPRAEKTRAEFLELVGELSPKDENGTITSYADFGSTFNVYKNAYAKRNDASRQKELASRTMQTSNGTSAPTQEGPMTWNKARNAINRMINN